MIPGQPPSPCRLCRKPRDINEAVSFGSLCGDCWADAAVECYGQQTDPRLAAWKPESAKRPGPRGEFPTRR